MKVIIIAFTLVESADCPCGNRKIRHLNSAILLSDKFLFTSAVAISVILLGLLAIPHSGTIINAQGCY